MGEHHGHGIFGAIKHTFDKVLKYSTPFANGWNAIIFLFRLLPATTLGEEIFDDEQEEFECTTSQPACKQMCYNRFSPMSHHRLWSLQILVISIPILIFSFIAAQSNAKFQLYIDTIEEYEKENDNLDNSTSTAQYPDADYHRKAKKYEKAKSKRGKYKQKRHMNYDEGKAEDIIWTSTIRRTYLVTCVIKLFMELMYIWHLYMLQKRQTNEEGFFNSEVWKIPEKYQCSVGEERHHACSQDTEVPCFVSRSWEKRIFLYYYITMSVGSILLIVLDIIYVVVKVSIKKVRRHKEEKQLRQQYYRNSNASINKLKRIDEDTRSNHSNQSFRSQKSRGKMFANSQPIGSRVDLIKDHEL